MEDGVVFTEESVFVYSQIVVGSGLENAEFVYLCESHRVCNFVFIFWEIFGVFVCFID